MLHCEYMSLTPPPGVSITLIDNDPYIKIPPYLLAQDLCMEFIGEYMGNLVCFRPYFIIISYNWVSVFWEVSFQYSHTLTHVRRVQHNTW
jgi:hypothetical protein